ncbi:MAG: hypothetical protein ACLFT6_09105, partial [Bacteroidales bacterium]
RKTGLITFHGPMSRTIHYEYSKQQFENIAINPSDKYLIVSCDEDLEKSTDNKVFDRYTINHGSAAYSDENGHPFRSKADSDFENKKNTFLKKI